MMSGRVTIYPRDRRHLDADVSDLVGTTALGAAEAQHTQTDCREKIIDALDSHGIAATEALVNDLVAVIGSEATTQAAEVLRHVMLRMDGTAASEGLRRVVLGGDYANESLRAAAKRCGVSAPALLKAEKRCRMKIGVNTPALK